MASVEHVDTTDMNSMSEEQMIADAMGTSVPEAPPTVAPEGVVEAPPAEQPTEEATDLAASLLAALGDDTTTETPASEAVKPPVDAAKLKELDQLFADTLGVNISSAVEKMTSFAQESEATMTRIQEAENRLALRMQEFELKQTWGSDPSVQGQDINQVVQDRIATLVPIYEKLAPELQQKLAQAGSRGVLLLWQQTQANRQGSPSQVTPPGRAAIAPTAAPQGAATMSEVIGIQDEEKYWAAVANNAKNQNLTDDVGARRSRR